MKTWAKDGHRDFSQEDLKRANRCMKTCSPSLSLRPRQIQTATTKQLTVVRMALRRQTGNNKRQRGGGEKGSLLHCCWQWKRSEERRVGKECRSRWQPY